MENSQAPRFKVSLRQKNQKIEAYFEQEPEEKRPLAYEDYVMLKRMADEDPIIKHIIKLFEAKLIKVEE